MAVTHDLQTHYEDKIPHKFSCIVKLGHCFTKAAIQYFQLYMTFFLIRFKKGTGQSLTPTSAQKGDLSARRSGRLPLSEARDWSSVSQEQRCRIEARLFHNAPIVTAPSSLHAYVQGHVIPDCQNAKSPEEKKNNERDCFSRAVT